MTDYTTYYNWNTIVDFISFDNYDQIAVGICPYEKYLIVGS